jgi:hypothetical protein
MTSMPDAAPYLHDGMLRQCIHCRCYQRHDDPDRWDAVPELEPAPATVPTTHRLCRACAQLFYP